LSVEEKWQFYNLFEKKNKKLAEIAKILNRTPATVKNYYYRNYNDWKFLKITLEEELLTF
jgi:hypothetical protein